MAVDDVRANTLIMAGHFGDGQGINFELDRYFVMAETDSLDMFAEAATFKGEERDLVTLFAQFGGQRHHARDRAIGGRARGADLNDVQALAASTRF